MEITRRTDYAIRLIAALVESDGEPLSVRSAADDYKVPYSFARSIQHDLVLAGIVRSVRGASGGMVLNVNPSNLTLLQIIESVQGPVGVAICVRESDWCPRERFCQFHPIWMGADALLKSYLSSVTIKEIVDGTKLPSIDPSFCQPGAFSRETLEEKFPGSGCLFCDSQQAQAAQQRGKAVNSLGLRDFIR